MIVQTDAKYEKLPAYWRKFLHVHTTHSDGHAGVEEVLEHAARRTDLRVIAITDHDTIDGALEARALAQEYGIEVVVGEEVSTADGELLALFVERRVPPGRPAAETIAAVHEQGGLAVAAHPYHRLVPSMGRRGLPRLASGPDPEWPLDAIETFNAGLVSPRNNRRAAALAAALGLPALGGSDSHHLGTIGYGHTLFQGRGAADLRAAMEFGRTVAAGRYWGLLRTAEVVGLIVRRELRDPKKRMGRKTWDRRPPSLAPEYEADFHAREPTTVSTRPESRASGSFTATSSGSDMLPTNSSAWSWRNCSADGASRRGVE